MRTASAHGLTVLVVSKRPLWELLTHPVETNEGGVGGKNKKDGGEGGGGRLPAKRV